MEIFRQFRPGDSRLRGELNQQVGTVIAYIENESNGTVVEFGNGDYVVSDKSLTKNKSQEITNRMPRRFTEIEVIENKKEADANKTETSEDGKSN